MRPSPLLVLLLLTMPACGRQEHSGAGADGAARGSATEDATSTAAAMPPQPAAPQTDRTMREARDEADFGGQGVAGGMARRADKAATQPAVANMAAGTAQSTATSVTGSATTAPAMVIRTGWVTVEVDSIEPALARIRQLATSLGGYVANAALQGGEEQARSATLELKVPAARFDEALGGVRPIGKVEGENVAAQDVGEEFVDVAARVQNARRLESRLIDLLARRTGKLSDVLAVERELARVREEIERHEGRLNYLRARTAMSTLSVTLHEPRPILAREPGESPIRDAFRAAWRNFVRVTAGLIASLGVVVPVGALGALAWMGWRRWGPRATPAIPE